MTVEPPPDHVLSAFGLAGVKPVYLGASWEGGWRCGEVVLSLVADNARAAWSARVRETLFVDGTDNFATRYLINDAAVLAGKPYVWGSIYRFEGQASVCWEDAPDGRGLNYRDLYPEPPPPGAVPSCAEGGVLGVVCAAIASVMSTEVIKLITGIGESLLGRLMIYDALEMSYRTIAIRRDPCDASRPAITTLVDYEQLCGAAPAASTDAATGGAEAAITPRQPRELLDSGAKLALLDVRGTGEFDIVHLGCATSSDTVSHSSGSATPIAPSLAPVSGGARSCGGVVPASAPPVAASVEAAGAAPHSCS